jgi:recombination protein RecT
MSNQQLVDYQHQVKDSLVRQYRKQIAKLLDGDEGRTDKFLAASVAVLSNPVYQDCSVESVVQATIGVAMLDLNIDKNVAHCYILPYKDWKTGVTSAQLQVSYKGMIQMLFRAGWAIKTHAVYKCDKFEMTVDDDAWDSKVSFVPSIDDRDEGDRDWCYQNLPGIYVVARHADTKDQYSLFVSKAVIEKLRLNSPSQKAAKFTKAEDRARLDAGLPIGIWNDWFVEMAQAKAVKKLAKLLPIGDKRAELGLAVDDKADMNQLINFEKTAETGVVIDIDATESKPARKSKASVDSLIGGQAETIIESEAVVLPTPKNGLVQPKPEPVVAAQQPVTAELEIDEAPDFGEFQPEPPEFIDDAPTTVIVGELMPQSTGTAQIPEVEPAQPQQDKTIANVVSMIRSWQTPAELSRGLTEIPSGYKTTFKKEISEQGVKINENISNWRSEITKCNTREEFAAVKKSMPRAILEIAEMRQLIQAREEASMNRYPDSW